MFGALVTVNSTFDEVLDHVIEQAYEGVRSMGQAVLEDAIGSMKFGGLPEHRQGGGFYESAPDGETPRSHTRKFIDSLDIAIENGRAFAGSKASEVGLRGSWFEFGNRPLLKAGDVIGNHVLTRDEVAHFRKRQYKQHPWLGPALDRQFDTFVPRVVGAFTS